MVEAGLASVDKVVVSMVAGWFRWCWFPWWSFGGVNLKGGEREVSCLYYFMLQFILFLCVRKNINNNVLVKK